MLSRRVDVALRHHVSAAHISAAVRRLWETEWRSVAPFTQHRTLSEKASNKSRHTTPQIVANTPQIDTQNTPTKASRTNKLSLADQLFPNAFEKLADNDAATNKPPATRRELPLLPVDELIPKQLRSSRGRPRWRKTTQTDYLDPKQWQTLSPGALTSVLRLDNASKNLTITDFQRLIPQAKYIEGWNLTQGDIISIIPGRFVHDLSQQTTYMLLFSSPESAQAFRRYAYTLYHVVKRYTPHNTQSNVPIAPGLIVNGVDVAHALSTFTICGPHQNFKLIQLKAPLTDHTAHMLAHGGPEILFKRPERMPFELRLTLNGMQISPSVMRKVFVHSGSERGAPWSGDQNMLFNMSRWQANTRHMDQYLENQANPKSIPEDSRAWVAPAPVYVLGFKTESAAQSFFHHWHKRPLTSSDESLIDYMDDVPPIVELETLW